ncbi:8512_t:CDS:2, partial [Entrophospora sp. SA101]
ANDKSPECQDYTHDGDKEILSDGCRTPVNQIKSDKLLRAATESLASPDESKYYFFYSENIYCLNILVVHTFQILNGSNIEQYFKEFISYFNEYKEIQLSDPYSCTNDDVMDICGECWKQILNDYFLETISSGPSLCFKNFGLNHALEKVVDGKFADILAQTWDTKEELFVGEQANAPTNPDLTKYATDWFKLYRELRDCLNLRILQAMKLGDINYNDHLVFGILGYLYEMKMTIMWKDGIYIYEEFGSFTIASHISMIHQMKARIIKLLEFMKIPRIITQTQESSPKRPKSKVAS